MQPGPSAVVRAGTGQNEGGCGTGGGGPDGYPVNYMSTCGPFSGAGTYYLVVTAATGIGSWDFTVEQLA